MTSINPVLLTTHGYVKGVQRCSVYNDYYYSFERIPYALPPVGPLRFKAPQPMPQPWEDTLYCCGDSVKPLQKDLLSGKIEGAEDCLYLNFYVKKLQSENALPVIVYLYGGSYRNGGATRENLSPDYFMMANVIVVTLNYRLGPLGFLSFHDPEVDVPGNAALRDQLLALQWIKDNCSNFNGDPNNITLFGNSAGSVMTHHLMNCNRAKGLFHKAILMSGTIHNSYSITPIGDYAYRLARATGFEGENIDAEVYEHLKNVPGDDLVSNDTSILTSEEIRSNVSFVFGPVIEPYESDTTVIATNPSEAVKQSWGNKIPLIVGGTSFEALYYLPIFKDNPLPVKALIDNPEYALPRSLRECNKLEDQQTLATEALTMHMGDNKLNMDNILEYLKMFSISKFWLGFQLTLCQRNRDAPDVPTYMYRFDYDSPVFNLSRIKYCGPDVRGACHSDDLSYLFYSSNAWKLPEDSADYRTIKRMMGIWCSFARNSFPNCDEIEPVIWTRSDVATPFKGINISTDITKFKESPEAEKLKWWLSKYAADNLY